MFNKILVCLDGSTLAEQIIPYAIEQALHFNAEVTLFQAVSVPSTVFVAPPVMAPGEPIPPTPTPEQVQEVKNEAWLYLESWAERMREKGLKVVSETWEDAPAEAITKYSAEKDVSLITMATHGRSGLGRTVMGSVADEVIRRSNLPILVLRPNEEAE
jgi:nucleotide-binding universal stress UspA family protein